MKALILIATLFFAPTSFAEEGLNYDCSFEGINGRALIAIGPKTEDSKGKPLRSVSSSFFVQGVEVPSLFDKCLFKDVKTSKAKVRCVHDDSLESRYDIYPIVDFASGQISKIKMIVWRKNSPSVYLGACQ